jgi:hypothetical protein
MDRTSCPSKVAEVLHLFLFMPTEIVRDPNGVTYTLVRQADPKACGLAAVATTILARMFVCPKDPPTEQSLLAQLGLSTIPDGGLARSQLAQLLTLNNIPHDVVSYGDTSAFIPDLKNRIKPKKPGILHVMRGTAGAYAGHWVTAVNVTPDFLVVLDPMYGLQLVDFTLLPHYPYVQRGGEGGGTGVVFSGQCLLTT